MFDCIIIGAGPAGTAAAYHLAKRGRSVLVVEKAAWPRKKPCGGGVSPAIAQWFDFDFTPAISSTVEKIRYTWKLTDPVESELGVPMWMVHRDIFDQYLLQQAQGQGAEFRDQTEVTGIQFKGDAWQVQTSGETLSGRYLIGADGAQGKTAEWLKLKQSKPRQSVMMEIQGETQLPTFEFGSVKNGNIWGFPKADSYSVSAATFRGGEPKNLQADLSNYAKKAGISGSSTPYEHSLRLWDGDKSLHTQNAVIAGEAACLVDPLSGEGIRPSILSGVKAAEAIDQALGGSIDALEGYTQTMHQEWGADMVWAGRLAGLFYRFPGVGYRAGVKVPAATRLLSKILCGELRYADVANKAIKSLSPI